MDGATAILNASHFGHADAVAQLLEAGADVESRDAHDMTPITAAIAMGHAGVVKVIVGYLHHRGLTAQVMERMDSRNFSPLHWAVRLLCGCVLCACVVSVCLCVWGGGGVRVRVDG